jgi:hypothetical protein
MTKMKTQEIFSTLLKEKIAPNLRSAGLKGSGQNYSLKSESHWALIGFQKSTSSSSLEVKFTINLYVVSKKEWEAGREESSYFPAKPTANISWRIGWNKRIGFLLPGNSDFWWSLTENTDLNTISQNIIESITEKAIPAILAQMPNA